MSSLSRSLHPAYHLRPNKAIDRAIFIELLRAYHIYKSLNKHIYIGLGGPFLEDFRLIANEFPKMRMLSIERDIETYKRQIFHKCSSTVKPLNCTFKEFLSSEFPSGTPTITWIDYTDFERQSLLEISDTVRKAVPGSVIRITVRAETNLFRALKISRDGRIKKIPENKMTEFKKFADDFRTKFTIQDVSYAQDLFEWPNFLELNYPKTLATMIYSVITASMTTPKTYLPLHSVMYSDSTIMLSVTGLICHEDEKKGLIKHFKSKCDFFSADMTKVDVIDIPMLTVKERLRLESRIPVKKIDGKKACAILRYMIEGDDSTPDFNWYKMAQYEKYHRLYPYFAKLIP